MKIILLTFAAIMLVGCNEKSDAAQGTQTWTVTRAGEDNSAGFYYAWRMNTQTGALEICLYTLHWMHKDASGNSYPDSPRCSEPTAAPSH